MPSTLSRGWWQALYNVGSIRHKKSVRSEEFIPLIFMRNKSLTTNLFYFVDRTDINLCTALTHRLSRSGTELVIDNCRSDPDSLHW